MEGLSVITNDTVTLVLKQVQGPFTSSSASSLAPVQKSLKGLFLFSDRTLEMLS